ncbi:MAG TPA: PQQ-dependent sugar dehydrogenase, partial [Candidatus Limnocylindria bacterium]|nr:PQQ-dependent sugar dehydrogenase [Candidatus Limnocylindria bacterium]
MSRPIALVAVLALLLVACEAESSPSSSAPSIQPSTSIQPESSSPPSTGPAMTDDALGVEPAVTGLTEPTGLAFLADDDFFVIEKSTGQVKRVQGGEAGEPVLDLAVNFFDERGLLGIALHPDFASNGYTYLYWTSSGAGEGEAGMLGPDTDVETELPELGNRVDRFVWDGEQLTWDRNIVQMRSNTLDTDTSGRIRGNHDAGPLVFGQDGTLFIVNGDQNLRGELQNIDGAGGLDAANWTGVVLRVNDDGSIPQDNPFVPAASALDGESAENLARIWAYGVRNSFGLAIHPDTGDLWQTENGDDSWDEVNIFPGGANSGWWQLIGPS